LVTLPSSLLLVDTGVGLLDVALPWRRLGPARLAWQGRPKAASYTLARRLEALGHDCEDVRAVVLTHLHPAHTGGLADFPQATVHVLGESLRNPTLRRGAVARHLAHQPKLVTAPAATERWFGFTAHRLPWSEIDLLMVPLPGHALGHAGVALHDGERWWLHLGDAVGCLDELGPTPGLHPQKEILRLCTDHRALLRLYTRERLRHLLRQAPAAIRLVASHGRTEQLDIKPTKRASQALPSP